MKRILLSLGLLASSYQLAAMDALAVPADRKQTAQVDHPVFNSSQDDLQQYVPLRTLFVGRLPSTTAEFRPDRHADIEAEWKSEKFATMWKDHPDYMQAQLRRIKSEHDIKLTNIALKAACIDEGAPWLNAIFSQGFIPCLGSHETVKLLLAACRYGHLAVVRTLLRHPLHRDLVNYQGDFSVDPIGSSQRINTVRMNSLGAAIAGPKLSWESYAAHNYKRFPPRKLSGERFQMLQELLAASGEPDSLIIDNMCSSGIWKHSLVTYLTEHFDMRESADKTNYAREAVSLLQSRGALAYDEAVRAYATPAQKACTEGHPKRALGYL